MHVLRLLAVSIAFAAFSTSLQAQGPQGQPPGGGQPGPGGGQMPQQMAQELGITPQQWIAACQKLPRRAQGQAPDPQQHEADLQILSESLHIPVDRIRTAMDKHRPGGGNGASQPGGPQGRGMQNGGSQGQGGMHRQGPPFANIAADLGVSEDQVRAAFQKVHPNGPTPGASEEQRRADHEALAAALGVTPERLHEVMEKYRPQHGPNDNGAPSAPSDLRVTPRR